MEGIQVLALIVPSLNVWTLTPGNAGCLVPSVKARNSPAPSLPSVSS